MQSSGGAVQAFNLSTWEADLSEFEASLVYNRSFKTAWTYTEQPCLEKPTNQPKKEDTNYEHTLGIPVLGGWKQENQKFKTSPGYETLSLPSVK